MIPWLHGAFCGCRRIAVQTWWPRATITTVQYGCRSLQDVSSHNRSTDIDFSRAPGLGLPACAETCAIPLGARACPPPERSPPSMTCMPLLPVTVPGQRPLKAIHPPPVSPVEFSLPARTNVCVFSTSVLHLFFVRFHQEPPTDEVDWAHQG